MTSRITLFVFFYILFICPLSWAQNDNLEPEYPAVKTYQELQQEIIRLTEAEKVRDTVIKNLIRRLEHLERSATMNPSGEEQSVADSADEDLQNTVAPEVQERIRQESEENYGLVAKAFEQRLNKQGGMLLPPFNLVYEPSISYTHASYDSIVVDGFTIFPVLVIGDIVAEKVRRDIVTNNHTFRLGLPWDMQFDLVVPLGYEKTRSFRDDGTHTANETDGLGDISLALSYQLINNLSFWPDTVVGVSWKSKSGDDPYSLRNRDIPSLGSGFETWGLSLTSIAVADPMVLFGGLSTTYTTEDEKSIGQVRPGQSFGVNLGMALSLNLDSSLSFGYSYNYSLETEINNQKIYGSDLTTSTFNVGFSRAKSDFFAVDLDLAIGLTQDATDFQFTVSFPFEFSLLDI